MNAYNAITNVMSTKESSIFRQRVIEGISLSGGVVSGVAYFHPLLSFSAHYKYLYDKETEIKNLDQAFADLITSISRLVIKIEGFVDHPSREILKTYLLLVNDESWKNQLKTAIIQGLSAEKAVINTLSNWRKQFDKNQFWQTRLHDLEDLSHRLLQKLKFLQSKEFTLPANQPVVLIANFLSPAELLEYQELQVVGLIVTDTGHISHSTIIAKSLNIPIVGGIVNPEHFISPNDRLLIDGDLGRIHVHPMKSTLASYDHKVISTQIFSDAPMVSLDGVNIGLHINANVMEEMSFVNQVNIRGVGLYRTELPFLIDRAIPTLQAQINLYQQAMDRGGGKPIIFRTFDIGGDKMFPNFLPKKYQEKLQQKEWRAIRLTLELPAIMCRQLRALIRAKIKSKYNESPLHILVPMLADVSEFLEFKKLFDLEIEKETHLGNKIPSVIKVGAMIEVPSLVYQLPELCKMVDFLSVGSNDLFQFLFAINRENHSLFDRYDILSISFLRFLKKIVDQSEVDLNICGEMASKPLGALALLGLGFRNLSVNPSAITPIYHMIRSLNLQDFSKQMNAVLSNPGTNSSLRPWLENYKKYQ